MRLLTMCIVLTLLSLNAPSFSPRASARSACCTLSGSVVDGNGDVIVGAEVTAANMKGDSKKATTDQKGSYLISGPEPGDYTVRAGKNGFAAFEKRRLKTARGETTHFDIELGIRLEEQVTVQAGTELSADPNNNMNQIVLSGSVLEALPDDLDDVGAALSALAGTPMGSSGEQTFVNGFSGGRLPSTSSTTASSSTRSSPGGGAPSVSRRRASSGRECSRISNSPDASSAPGPHRRRPGSASRATRATRPTFSSSRPPATSRATSTSTTVTSTVGSRKTSARWTACLSRTVSSVPPSTLPPMQQ